MSNECGFTCLACGQFRPGPEGAHSEAACLRVQLAAANDKLKESARLATESAQLADGLAKDLAAANEQCERSCAEVLDWREQAKGWITKIDALSGQVKSMTAQAESIGESLAAANERAGRLERDYQKARAAFLRLRKQPRQSTLDVVCDLDDLDEYFEGGA